jgi:hypothetical protein
MPRSKKLPLLPFWEKKDYGPKKISPPFCLTRTKSKQRKQITVDPKKSPGKKNCFSNKNNGTIKKFSEKKYKIKIFYC